MLWAPASTFLLPVLSKEELFCLLDFFCRDKGVVLQYANFSLFNILQILNKSQRCIKAHPRCTTYLSKVVIIVWFHHLFHYHCNIILAGWASPLTWEDNGTKDGHTDTTLSTVSLHDLHSVYGRFLLLFGHCQHWPVVGSQSHVHQHKAWPAHDHTVTTSWEACIIGLCLPCFYDHSNVNSDTHCIHV